MVWFPKQNLPSKLWRYAKYSIILQYIYLISKVVYLINPYRCRWVGQNLCCACGQTWSMHKWVNLRRSSEFRQDTDCKQIRTRRLCKILFVVMVSLQTLFFVIFVTWSLERVDLVPYSFTVMKNVEYQGTLRRVQKNKKRKMKNGKNTWIGGENEWIDKWNLNKSKWIINKVLIWIFAVQEIGLRYTTPCVTIIWFSKEGTQCVELFARYTHRVHLADLKNLIL